MVAQNKVIISNKSLDRQYLQPDVVQLERFLMDFFQ